MFKEWKKKNVKNPGWKFVVWCVSCSPNKIHPDYDAYLWRTGQKQGRYDYVNHLLLLSSSQFRLNWKTPDWKQRSQITVHSTIILLPMSANVLVTHWYSLLVDMFVCHNYLSECPLLLQITMLAIHSISLQSSHITNETKPTKYK